MKYSNSIELKNKARAYYIEHKSIIDSIASENEMMFVAGAMFAMDAIDKLESQLNPMLQGQFN